METKKNASVDLTRKENFFFSIGLFLALSMIVMAFEWRQHDKPIVNLGNKNENTFEELIDIPPTRDIPPPPVPAIINPVLVEVDPKVVVDSIPRIDIESTELLKPVTYVLPPAEPEINDEIPFTVVQEPASPKDGYEAFYKYVGEKIKYPAQAQRMGIEGRVFVEFTINKDGSLSGVRAIKGIGAGCDEEAVRIVESAPAWNPGKQRGKAVRQRLTLPIIFKLR